jgi:hypothetical protein
MPRVRGGHRGPRLSKGENLRGAKRRVFLMGSEYPETFERPQTRADCVDGRRPCPFVGCRHHLFLEVQERSGNLSYRYGHAELDELAHTCSLDLAETPHTLEEVGEILGVTRERVRQLQASALAKMGPDLVDQGNDLCGTGERYKLHEP